MFCPPLDRSTRIQARTPDHPPRGSAVPEDRGAVRCCQLVC